MTRKLTHEEKVRRRIVRRLNRFSDMLSVSEYVSGAELAKRANSRPLGISDPNSTPDTARRCDDAPALTNKPRI